MIKHWIRINFLWYWKLWEKGLLDRILKVQRVANEWCLKNGVRFKSLRDTLYFKKSCFQPRGWTVSKNSLLIRSLSNLSQKSKIHFGFTIYRHRDRLDLSPVELTIEHTLCILDNTNDIVDVSDCEHGGRGGWWWEGVRRGEGSV